MASPDGMITLAECCCKLWYNELKGEEEGEPDADGGEGGSGAAGGDAAGSPNGGGEIPQNLVMSGASPGFSARFPIPQQPLGAPRATPLSLPPHSAFRGRTDETIHPFPLPAARDEGGSGDRDAAHRQAPGERRPALALPALDGTGNGFPTFQSQPRLFRCMDDSGRRSWDCVSIRGYAASGRRCSLETAPPSMLTLGISVPVQSSAPHQSHKDLIK